MESTSARDIDRRLADLIRNERHFTVQFVIELPTTPVASAELAPVPAGTSRTCLEHSHSTHREHNPEAHTGAEAVNNAQADSRRALVAHDRYVAASVKRAVWERDQGNSMNSSPRQVE